jgi:hypothetical protein
VRPPRLSERERGRDGEVNRHPALLVVHVAAVACLSLVGCGPSATSEPPRASAKPSVKILFVGDSITAWNGGLGGHMEQLAASRNPPRPIEADQVTQFGAPLELLWKDTDARQEIRENAYDFVCGPIREGHQGIWG